MLVASGCSSADEGAPATGWHADASAEVGVDAQAEPEPMVETSAEGWVEAQAEASLEAAAESSLEAQVEAGACPAEMVLVGSVCMDRYEAPNKLGELPLVMLHFDEAESWCAHRGKRLCFDDEWTLACGGPDALAYPYGDTLDPGVCNDDQVWKQYNQTLLNGWPWTLATDEIETLGELLDAARATGATGKAAADHVEALYQGTAAGVKIGCVGPAAVFDLTGNVEEWTRRRDGGETSFHGNLKGRYWAESRTCQQGVKTHGDTFRFYEIGFRCCREL